MLCSRVGVTPSGGAFATDEHAAGNNNNPMIQASIVIRCFGWRFFELILIFSTLEQPGDCVGWFQLPSHLGYIILPYMDTDMADNLLCENGA